MSSDRRNRITKDSESSTRWTLRGCIGAQEDITAECSGKIYSLSSRIQKKNPLRDLHRVAEHPATLSKKLVEQKDSRDGIHICPPTGERKKDKIP